MIGQKERIDVKRKVLLLTSLFAIIFGVALLIAPDYATAGFRCTTCTAVDSSGNRVSANCQVAPVDSCFCPLSGTIVKNGCLGIQ